MNQGSANNGNPSFAQQGTVDWVGLSQMQFSASIAVLGRLASAGIDSLTVAFGQAMCSRIPLGAHGEKVLRDAMKGLVSLSTFGDVIWFGVGIRHLLRDLVQTSQGSALVALCGALTEGYSRAGSALVLYEVAKLCGGPKDLLPSFAQWEALIKVAASVFNNTTLGLRMGQISRLGGYLNDKRASVGHPADFAQVILAIGRVVAGELETIVIQGGLPSSWIAAWSDFVLDLRVQVRSREGRIVFVNYDPTTHDAQVMVDFVEEEDTTAVQCISRVMAIRSGTDFVQQCFGREKLLRPGDPDLSFL